MKTAKVLQVKTEAVAHIVIRNGAGKKLFDLDLSGVSITVTVPPDAEINRDDLDESTADFVVSTNGLGVFIMTPLTDRARVWTDSILPVLGSELMTTTRYIRDIVVGLRREGYVVQR
jgi:hypothetical protein